MIFNAFIRIITMLYIKRIVKLQNKLILARKYQDKLNQCGIFLTYFRKKSKKFQNLLHLNYSTKF